MSAINPASFASPSLGLQAPSGVGPGAVGANRQSQIDRRQQQPEQPNYNNLAPGGRGYPGGAAGAVQTPLDRSNVSQTSFPQPFAHGYSTFAAAPRKSAGNYGPNLPQQVDPFVTFATTSDYHSFPGRFPSPHSVGHGKDHGDYARQGNNDGFMNSFQGLSLNSR